MGIAWSGHSPWGGHGGQKIGTRTEKRLSLDAIRRCHSSWASQMKSRPLKENARRRFVAIAMVAVCPPNVAVLTRESPSEARVSSAFNTKLGSAHGLNACS